MQSVEEPKGVSPKSQLLDSLKGYLNNKNRLQPIIGLSSIIECVNAGTHNREALYLCEVCACRPSKADIRNHITGSLHRYNYIKAWHPDLVSEWKENFDLSKLAWPLMEKATCLEGKEGPGDVQLFELQDALFRRMATHSENDAISLINILRNGLRQGGAEGLSETTAPLHYPYESERIVLLAQHQEKPIENSVETSVEINEPPSLGQSTVAPYSDLEGRLDNTPVSPLDSTETWPGPSVLSENSSTFLDDYTGDEPLIGLFRVVECRSEDGYTYCFLCHWCRIRANKKDIIDHLTSSSHLVNYLMETIPEQVDVIMADISDNYQLLLSFAKNVEQEQGRGELKVVKAPESLCVLLKGKSYHWCIKMLSDELHENQKRYTAVRGPRMNRNPNQLVSEKRGEVLSKNLKKKKKKQQKKGRKVTNASDPVFKVSLPVTKGSMLLQRMPFSEEDGVPLSSGRSPSHGSRGLSEVGERDFGRNILSCVVYNNGHSSELQQDVYRRDEDAGQFTGPESNFTVSQYQELDGNIGGSDYLCQSEDMPGKNGDNWEQNYNRWHCYHERSCDWQTEGLPSASYHTQDGSLHNSSYGHENCCNEQWYCPGDERKRQMSADAAQYYNHHQQPQNQYMGQADTGPQTGSTGQHGWCGESAANVNTHPHLGDPIAHSGSVAPEPREQFVEVDQRCWQFTTSHVQTAPQSYMTQHMPYQASQVGHGWISYPNYNSGPWTNPCQHFRHPCYGANS